MRGREIIFVSPKHTRFTNTYDKLWMLKILEYVIAETIEKTLQADVLESVPDQDEKIDNLLNETHITNLPVRNVI